MEYFTQEMHQENPSPLPSYLPNLPSMGMAMGGGILVCLDLYFFKTVLPLLINHHTSFR